jgi:hypothetical protein
MRQALGMLLTLFGTPFFVTLGFSGIVHILYKRRAARRCSGNACAA